MNLYLQEGKLKLKKLKRKLKFEDGENVASTSEFYRQQLSKSVEMTFEKISCYRRNLISRFKNIYIKRILNSTELMSPQYCMIVLQPI